ncbi:wax ester synthase-like acyl-CoA acyltransferase domain-containing protein [Dichomitus squalens]|uniref:Wax ester synthase-like acyl-CoA acyltransferase domain-containing protein n=1 Tax=Dichomitus squalens TaxID=114155 RepID=A0A4Q9MQM0_9APHY|nr:wax ester synthase-like acyl-CoA acyltransferase domain-containing protein [Dichomitus squalens]
MVLQRRILNGHVHVASPGTPASYYYDDGDVQPPAPEDVDAKLNRVGSVGEVADCVADFIAQEATERRQMIGGVDNFWLLLSDITDFNPVCACTSVCILRDYVTVEKVAQQFTRQSERFPRFRQKLESVGRLFHGPTFVDDPDSNVLNHIHVRRLPEPAGKRELDALVGEFIAEDWDLSKPLWHTLIVENYHGDDGACAIVAKGHHTLSDGQGFVMSQLYLTSFFDDLAQMMNRASDKLDRAKRGLLLPSEYSKSFKPLDPYASDERVAPFLQFLLGLLFWLIVVAKNIFSLFWSTFQGLRMIAFFLFTFWRVEMITADQPGKRTPHREFSSTRIFSLQDVKVCQQAFSGPRPGYAVAGVPKDQRRNVRSKKRHVTLNDVVCAVMADVLGDIIASKPEPRTAWGKVRRTVNKYLPSPMGFFIPISVRKPGDWSMRNLSTASNVYLNPSPNLTSDISVHEIHAHIHRCRYELSLFKHSAWPKFCFRLLQLTGQAPILFPLSWFSRSRAHWNPLVKVLRNGVVKPFLDVCLESCTAILTNVPGPSKGPITWSGVEVVKWSAIPPQAGAGTVGIGIMSYAGGLSVAVSADLVPGSEGVARRICEGFEKRFELYVARAKEVLDHQD